MSAERVIFINLLLYLLGFSFFLYKRHQLSEQSIGLLSVVINALGVLFSMGIRLSDISGEVISYKWFYVGNSLFSVDILINDLTFFMYFVVQFVALWVQIFSLKYMSGDDGFGRYIAYINLFVLSMLGLVISGNLILIYIFWELVGVSSYLLIGFWQKKYSATNAAKKAFIVNRVGDVGFFIGIVLLYRFFGTFNVNEIIEKVQVMSFAQLNSPVMTTIGILIFCGCIAKSAQFPLQVWLPDAMEGPTPISALIHAATMVAAGILLMARIFPILSTDARLVMTIIGTTTMLLGALSALVQYDIKKLLAYSTISQLGIMVVGLGVGAVNASLFHLITHAFFKAGLFLSAGAVIHHTHHEQDMRKMGGLRKQIPIIYYGHTICAAALAGIPLFSGFLSKDAIIVGAFEWASKQPNQWAFVVPSLTLVTAGLSAYYMMRQVFLVYFERDANPLKLISDSAKSIYKNVSKTIENIVNVEDDDNQQPQLTDSFNITSLEKIGVMEWAVIVMAVASIGFIFSTNPFVFEESWFFHTFPYHPKSYQWVAYVSVLVALNGILLGYILTKEETYNLDVNQTEPRNPISRLFFHNYYLNELYHYVFVYPFVGFKKNKEVFEYESDGNGLVQKVNAFDKNIIDKSVDAIANFWVKISIAVAWFDQTFVDGFVNFFANGIGRVGSYTRLIQNGKAQSYIISTFVGLILLIVFLVSF